MVASACGSILKTIFCLSAFLGVSPRGTCPVGRIAFASWPTALISTQMAVNGTTVLSWRERLSVAEALTVGSGLLLWAAAARRRVLSRVVAWGYHRRLPPLILVLIRDCLARLAMRACLAAAVAALPLAGASDHTQGTRPRPR